MEIVEAIPDDAGKADPLTGEACGFDPQGGQLIYAEVQGALPVLQSNGIRVSLAIQAHKLNAYFDGETTAMDEIAGLIDQAAPGQIMPLLVLSWCDGYFPGSTNYDIFVDAAQKLDQWWRIEQGYDPTEFIIDMETRWSRANVFNAVEDLAPQLDLLSSWINPSEFAAATSAYADLVDDLHAGGWSVVATTSGYLLDDFRDGDDDLLQAYGVPLVGIEWDAIHWQLYRTLFQDALPWGSPQMSNFLVYDYLKNTGHDVMSQYFPGASLGVDVGLTDAGPVFPEGNTYDDVFFGQGTPAEVRLDVEAAARAGVAPDRITVYSLKGLHDAGLENLLDAPRWWVSRPFFDGATGLLHTLMYVVDASL